MNDSRLLDCGSMAKIEANLIRMMALIDAKMAATKILWWTPSNAATATGTLTIATNPTADDTMTIGTKEYTFVAEAAADGEISIGLDKAATQANVKAAINGTDSINTAHPSVTCGDFTDDAATITANAAGAAGNVVTTETFQAIGNVFGAATLEGGVNGTVGTQGDVMMDADYIYVCTADNTILDANWKKAALA